MNKEDLINNHGKEEFTSSKLMEIIKKYEELKKHEEEYKSNIVQRKELSNTILKEIDNLSYLMDVFKINVRKDRNTYIFNNYISDYFLILYALLKIANQEKRQYILKKLEVLDSMHHEGFIWLIGDRVILNKINNKKKINPSVFKRGITDIINNNYSIVLVTDYVCNWNVIPENIDINNANVNRFKIDGAISDLCCYTYDDELGLAVEKLNKYVEKYGGDIKDISIDNLVSMIDNVDNNKKLIKNDYI